MSRFRRSIALVLIAALATGAVLLGRWQLRRLDARRASNEHLAAARAAPPLAITATLADSMLDGRRIVARGIFDTSFQVLLRGRNHLSTPGLHVVTPFTVPGGPTLWVLRGFVASHDATTPPDSIPPPTPGLVTIRGTAFDLPVTDDHGQPIGNGRARTYRRLDAAEMKTMLPAAPPIYVILDGDREGPGQLAGVAVPALDDGPHLSYALQWFAIAAAIAAFGIIVIRRDGRGPPRLRAAP